MVGSADLAAGSCSAAFAKECVGVLKSTFVVTTEQYRL